MLQRTLHRSSLAVALAASALPFVSPGLSAQSLTATPQATPVDQPVRAIVAMKGGMPTRAPFVVRCAGMTLQQQAAEHAADIQERKMRCLLSAEQLEFGLRPLGGQILQQLPVFQTCIISVPASKLAAVRKLDNVLGVWRDTHAPSFVRGTSRSAPPTDDVGLTVEHHRALLAHKGGYTGAGSGTWAPVVAILDGWLEGLFGPSPGVQRHHVALREGGLTTGSKRVLADLDWSPTGTPLPARPLNVAGKQPTDPPWRNVYHGLGVAGIAAGSAVPSGAGYEFEVGHAKNAGIVGMNIVRWVGGHTTACNTWQTGGNWAYQIEVLAGLNRIAMMKFTYTGGQPVEGDPLRPIQVANLSYGGPPNPGHPTNNALRTLMADFDILPVTAAGNDQTRFESLYNVNGLCVASYDAWLSTMGGVWGRTVSAFSNRGPLTQANTSQYCQAGGDADVSWRLPNTSLERDFPDIGAIGSWQRVALQDVEASFGWAEGTSIAAPHVSGAALLAMAGPDGNTPATPWTSLETRAALLAATENANVNGMADNASGAGFLRTDRVTSAASVHELSASIVTIQPIVNTTTTLSTFNVQAGRTYSVAIAWLANQVSTGITAPNWVDLDLNVAWPGGSLVAAAASGNRTWERLEFVAATSGVATISVNSVRVPTANVSLPVAVAHARVDAAGGAPANVAHLPSTTPATCQVQQIQPASQLAYQSFGSTPLQPIHDLREVVSPGLAQKDRWVAFKFDGMRVTAFGICSYAWAAGSHFSVPHVTKVELRTNSPRDIIVPCMLASGGTGGGPFSSTYPRNEWNGWLRIPAGLGYATAEFSAKSDSSSLQFSPPRWFCVKMPPDVLFCQEASDPCFPPPYCAFATASNDDGSQYNQPTWMVGFDMRVYGPASTPFASGYPTLRTIEPASLTSGGLDLFISGGEASASTLNGTGFLLIDTSPGEGNLIQALDPAYNATCKSLLKANTLYLPQAGVFGVNTGAGHQDNPPFGTTGRVSLDFAPAAALIGATVYLQFVETIPQTGGAALRPSSIEGVTMGL